MAGVLGFFSFLPSDPSARTDGWAHTRTKTNIYTITNTNMFADQRLFDVFRCFLKASMGFLVVSNGFLMVVSCLFDEFFFSYFVCV